MWVLLIALTLPGQDVRMHEVSLVFTKEACAVAKAQAVADLSGPGRIASGTCLKK